MHGWPIWECGSQPKWRKTNGVSEPAPRHVGGGLLGGEKSAACPSCRSSALPMSPLIAPETQWTARRPPNAEETKQALKAAATSEAALGTSVSVMMHYWGDREELPLGD
eukprot:Gregarina_sp_Poly_1__8039@NODE_461_length_8201_cov_115_438530_g375_i0_p9_GENE_NODE_461_length_8201_cov_115_438530_g375_i0NODE_461_length_8201_cov_115_438530_g375_i0_p9_ORF_typecomplete_len109_score11_75MEF2_binding/PF09047_10/0_16TetR_N/PF00440_23/0_13DUF1178/PF06676_11/0_2_NODE_461_length_8201_cov_115_438530_g375_i076177943